MILLYFLLWGYMGNVLAKFWSGIFSSPDSNRISIFLLQLIPFHALFLLQFRTKNYRIDMWCETVGCVTSLIFAASLLQLAQYIQASLPVVLVIMLLTAIFFFGLLYLALYDMRTYTIPTEVTKNILFVIIACEAVVACTSLILGTVHIFDSTTGLSIGTLSNILGGLVGYLVIKSIIILTNNKGMGEGDVDTSLVIGIVLGLQYFWLSFLMTILAGFIVSIVVMVLRKQYKGYVIPFVPLQLIGFTIVLGFGKELSQLLLGI